MYLAFPVFQSARSTAKIPSLTKDYSRALLTSHERILFHEKVFLTTSKHFWEVPSSSKLTCSERRRVLAHHTIPYWVGLGINAPIARRYALCRMHRPKHSTNSRQKIYSRKETKLKYKQMVSNAFCERSAEKFHIIRLHIIPTTYIPLRLQLVAEYSHPVKCWSSKDDNKTYTPVFWK